MKTGDYRRDYAAYRAALERARYDYHTNLGPELRLAPLRERYADLWTRQSIDELTRARDETPAQFETERAALAALIHAARQGYLETRSAEVTSELVRCEASARLEWGGASLASNDVSNALAVETDAPRRRELAARWLDALRVCDALRAACLGARHDAARALGFNSYFDFLAGDANAVDESLRAGADDFLERTAPVYAANLFNWAARHLPPAAARAPVYADSLFFARLAHLDQLFPASGLRAAYDSLLGGLGIRVERQGNVRVEAKTKQSGSACAGCFPLNPPVDVRLVFQVSDGASFYRSFFAAAGDTQHFAWVSRDLAARYPELVYASDGTTRAGFAFLFGDLLSDMAWLGTQRNVTSSEAREIARSVTIVELHHTRRACAQLRYQRVLDKAGDSRSEHLAEAYAATLEEATRFHYHPALHLRDAVSGSLQHPDESRSLPPAAYLRARLFATALGEYLRTRHGQRWWATRGAADELIDMWNTGSRYTVEELASLTGLGALNFDLLADSWQALLSGE